MSERECVGMKNKSFDERLQELKQKYEPFDDFDLVAILQLENEYSHIRTTHPDYVKKRHDILAMRQTLIANIPTKTCENTISLNNNTKTEEKNQMTKYKTLKTIGLFAEKDFGFTRQTDACATVDLTSNGDMTLTANMSAILRKRLAEGKEKNAFIDVTGFRGIGKTYELVDFAKKRDYAVICATQYLAELVRVKYVYQKVFGQSDNLRGVDGVFVADEGVDIQKLIDLGVNVITGYISR